MFRLQRHLDQRKYKCIQLIILLNPSNFESAANQLWIRNHRSIFLKINSPIHPIEVLLTYTQPDHVEETSNDDRQKIDQAPRWG